MSSHGECKLDKPSVSEIASCPLEYNVGVSCVVSKLGQAKMAFTVLTMCMLHDAPWPFDDNITSYSGFTCFFSSSYINTIMFS